MVLPKVITLVAGLKDDGETETTSKKMDVMTVDSKLFIGVNNRSDFLLFPSIWRLQKFHIYRSSLNSCEAATVQQVIQDTGLGIKRLII